METVAAWMMARATAASRRAIAAQAEGNLHFAAMDQAAAAAIYAMAADLREGRMEGSSDDMMITLDIQGDYTADLKARMEKVGVTPAELAKRAGISPSQLSRWFTTDMQPRIESIQKLEEAHAAILADRKGKKKRK